MAWSLAPVFFVIVAHALECDGFIALRSPAHQRHALRSRRAAATTTTTIDEVRGFAEFQRENPRSDKFEVLGFDHVEFWCGDASTTCRRWAHGLGMPIVAKSDASTGNTECASYMLGTGELRFMFTAPTSVNGTGSPFPSFSGDECHSFFRTHGLAVRAVCLRVKDAREAYEASVTAGARPGSAPSTITDSAGRSSRVAEVELYGDVVLRFVEPSSDTEDLLPGFESVPDSEAGPKTSIDRIDHVVGNVWELLPVANYLTAITGFHEFAEFVAADVGTVESGLNSLVLASNDERVLLPLNEPTYGTKRQSQIQTYLEHAHGPGVQHIALHTGDIFETIAHMRKASPFGGFELMDRPSDEYYRELPNRLGDSLSPSQYKEVERLGILADKDDQEGVLLQIFTKPVGDRPTLFLEIIQRLGCIEDGKQLPACGGFGRGNFRELFKSIEDYERSIGV